MFKLNLFNYFKFPYFYFRTHFSYISDFDLVTIRLTATQNIEVKVVQARLAKLSKRWTIMLDKFYRWSKNLELMTIRLSYSCQTMVLSLGATLKFRQWSTPKDRIYGTCIVTIKTRSQLMENGINLTAVKTAHTKAAIECPFYGDIQGWSKHHVKNASHMYRILMCFERLATLLAISICRAMRHRIADHFFHCWKKAEAPKKNELYLDNHTCSIAYFKVKLSILFNYTVETFIFCE